MSLDRPRSARPFAKVPEWLIAADDGASPLRVFAWMAARYANVRNECWASRKRLATDLGVTERSIDRALVDLQRMGALTTRPRKRADGSPAKDCYVLAGESFLSEPVDKIVYSDEPKVDKNVYPEATKMSPPIELDPIELDPGAKAPPRTRARRETKNRSITSAAIEALAVKWSEKYGNPDEVREIMADALNHEARRRCIDEQRYVDGWLRRELRRNPELGKDGARSSHRASRFAVPEPASGMVGIRYTSDEPGGGLARR